MAGDWMKIELELPDKPEVHYIAGVVNLDPDAVVGKLIRIWQWFNKHTEDGNAVGVTFALPDRIAGVTGFGEAMQFAGWLIQDGSTLTMPKFDRHTSESAKSRANAASRQNKFRNKSQESNAKRNDATVTSPSQREEKRREEYTKSKTLSGKPDELPPAEKDEHPKAQARQLIDFLNDRAGKAFRHTEANLEPILARLKEGYSLQDLKTVTVRKCRDWASDEQMAQYLRPATLYNRTKFNQYIGECVE